MTSDTTDSRLLLKLAVERLSDLEEQLAHVNYMTASDAEASAERQRLLDEIENQKLTIADLEASL